MAAFDQFYNMNSQDLHYLNQAYVVLIPKKPNTTKISEFRPISLIHTFAKLVSKVLVNRLAPELKKMISINQNAFMKKRCIHDNFMFVQQVIKDLHKKKVPALFIKLDISKAFDSVSWSYLLDILSYLGFGLRWHNWISSLWCTTSFSFLLNGAPGRKIKHARGVRQGDPLSPMIFLLAMEPLHRMFQTAQTLGALQIVHAKCSNFRMLLYADDAALFIKPTKHDLAVTKFLLQLFGDASGLITNMQKTEFFPIRCNGIDPRDLLDNEQRLSQFPCSYLGIPLHYKKLPKEAIQPMVQKIGNRLLGWKRNFLTYEGRQLLVKTVLTEMPTHFLIVFKLPSWACKQIDRYRRSFLWRGDDPDKICGGHCLVSWRMCIRPKKLGGLDIKNLDRYGRALRLRWLWHLWDECERPWRKLLKHKDLTDRELFFNSTTITLGDGKSTPFWEGR